MNILMTGGTGFIGRRLCQHWLAAGHKLTVLTRDVVKAGKRSVTGVAYIDRLDALGHQDHFDIVVNLSGAGIADRRWSRARKHQLQHSRIDATNTLVEFLAGLSRRPSHLISMSAVGYYGDQQDQIVDEDSVPNPDFAHQLCADWESAALWAIPLGLAVTIIRCGIVLSDQGGFLKKMLLPFRLGLGGKLGDGGQYMSWIHLDDLLAIFDYLLTSPDRNNGDTVINATAPYPVTNAEFTQALARRLRRPAKMTLPASLLQLMFGEMSLLLLAGQRVVPAKLQDGGFGFSYPRLPAALQSLRL